MSKENFYKNGYTSTDAFSENFIRDLEDIIKMSIPEKLDLGVDTTVEIIDWEKDDALSKKCLKIIKEKINEHTGISQKFLDKNFTYKVYLSLDTNKSIHQNQIPHFDSFPSIKLQIHLSNNSVKESGCTHFIKSSHKSLYMKKIRFLRLFFVPGKHGMQKSKEYEKIIQNGCKVFVGGDKYTGTIFDTDTLHYAGKVEKQDFVRKIIRFDFKKKKTLGFYFDAFFSKINKYINT
jgi:hypothetical protein